MFQYILHKYIDNVIVYCLKEIIYISKNRRLKIALCSSQAYYIESDGFVSPLLASRHVIYIITCKCKHPYFTPPWH